MFIGLGLALTRQSGRGSPPAFVNTVAPVVSGTVTEGQTLSVTNGTWDPVPAGYTYQWYRDGVAIGSATSNTYALVAADGGTNIYARVTANDGGSEETTAQSNTVGPVAQADPVYVSGASITGTTAVSSTLTAVTGTWTGSPSFTYQWRRNNSNIGGATASTYLLDVADETQLIDVVITGTNAFGSASTTTADVGPIDPAPDIESLELYAGGNLELYGGGTLELYAASLALALYSGGLLELYSGGFLELYGSTPAETFDSIPIIFQYIL